MRMTFTIFDQRCSYFAQEFPMMVHRLKQRCQITNMTFESEIKVKHILNAKETHPFSINFFFHLDHMRLIS